MPNVQMMYLSNRCKKDLQGDEAGIFQLYTRSGTLAAFTLYLPLNLILKGSLKEFLFDDRFPEGVTEGFKDSRLCSFHLTEATYLHQAEALQWWRPRRFCH